MSFFKSSNTEEETYCPCEEDVVVPTEFETDPFKISGPFRGLATMDRKTPFAKPPQNNSKNIYAFNNARNKEIEKTIQQFGGYRNVPPPPPPPPPVVLPPPRPRRIDRFDIEDEERENTILIAVVIGIIIILFMAILLFKRLHHHHYAPIARFRQRSIMAIVPKTDYPLFNDQQPISVADKIADALNVVEQKEEIPAPAPAAPPAPAYQPPAPEPAPAPAPAPEPTYFTTPAPEPAPAPAPASEPTPEPIPVSLPPQMPEAVISGGDVPDVVF